jgi:hypothetical protein
MACKVKAVGTLQDFCAGHEARGCCDELCHEEPAGKQALQETFCEHGCL